jgi:hypothetical protein
MLRRVRDLISRTHLSLARDSPVVRPACSRTHPTTARPWWIASSIYPDLIDGRDRIRDRPISPRSPWQNPYVERLIGTLRRDCLDRVLIFGERHLQRVMTSYSVYYNETRTHLGLGKDAPLGRAVERSGTVVAIPVLITSSLRADTIFGKDRHRMRVSGRKIVVALRMVGNHRYSWMNKRSPSVSRTPPRTFRRNMTS